MDVLALQVLNALGLDGLGIRQLDYADRKFFEFRQFSSLLGDVPRLQSHRTQSGHSIAARTRS